MNDTIDWKASIPNLSFEQAAACAYASGITNIELRAAFSEAGLTGCDTPTSIAADLILQYLTWARGAGAIGSAGASLLHKISSWASGDRAAGNVRQGGRDDGSSRPKTGEPDELGSKVQAPKGPRIVYRDPRTLSIDESLKALVPRPDADKRAAMLASIKAHGVQTPIPARACDERVYDGFTRTELAIEAGLTDVPLLLEEIPPDEDLASRTIRSAVERRQLTDWQVICLAPRYMEIEKERTKARTSVRGVPGMAPGRTGKSRDLVAEDLGIKKTRLQMGLKLLTEAPGDIKDRLASGDLTITGAYNMLWPSKSKDEVPESVDDEEILTESKLDEGEKPEKESRLSSGIDDIDAEYEAIPDESEGVQQPKMKPTEAPTKAPRKKAPAIDPNFKALDSLMGDIIHIRAEVLLHIEAGSQLTAGKLMALKAEAQGLINDLDDMLGVPDIKASAALENALTEIVNI